MERSGRYENRLERGSPPSAVTVETFLPQARAAGFSLVQYETDTGQLVFEWRRGDERGPQFLNRHLAMLWLVDRFEREQDVLGAATTDDSLDRRVEALHDS